MVRAVKSLCLALLVTVASQGDPAFAENAQGNWKRLEADNGAVFAIDLNSITRFNNGTVQAVTCVAHNGVCPPPNMSRFWFDCSGHYRDLDRRGPTMSAPPRSVVGRMAQIACAGAKDTRLEDSASPQPKPTPAHYCAGFSAESCARIVTAVKATRKPDYCKPGYGLVGSGLSTEQLRICHVRGSGENQTENEAVTRVAEGKPKVRSYNVTLRAINGEFPNIIGDTNLPDGTKLLVSITKPRLPNASELFAAGRPMCEDDCLPAAGPKGELLGVATTALSGVFSAGPFSWAGKPFRKGTFEVEIFLVSFPGEEPKNVQDYEKLADRMKKPILISSVVVAP